MKAPSEPPPRTLAEVLREAGIEPAGRGGRRRRTEDGPRPDGPVAAEPAATAPEAGPPVITREPAAAPRRHRRRAARDDEDVPDPLMPPTGQPAGSDATVTAVPLPQQEQAEEEQPPDGGPEPAADVQAAQRVGAADIEPAPDLGSGDEPRSGVDVEPAPDAGPDSDAAPGSADRTTSRRSGVLGWLVFLVELAAAAALGVLIWYVFSLLWELYPYVAAVAAPFVLAGVVLIAEALRRRRSQERLSAAVTVALLLVTAFLVVLPAAAVLAGS